MKDFIFSSELRQILELIYFLSAPGLLIIAFFGLKQLKIAKETLRINSLRDASKLSIELTNSFDINLKNAYVKLCQALKVKKLEPEFKFYDFSIEYYKKLPIKEKEELENNFKIAIYAYVQMAETMEDFAMPFINKIADEQIAYNAVGGRYCIYMGQCYPAIMDARIRENSCIPYSDSVALYNIWYQKHKNQITKEKIETLKDEISFEIKDEMKPVGT